MLGLFLFIAYLVITLRYPFNQHTNDQKNSQNTRFLTFNAGHWSLVFYKK